MLPTLSSSEEIADGDNPHILSRRLLHRGNHLRVLYRVAGPAGPTHPRSACGGSTRYGEADPVTQVAESRPLFGKRIVVTRATAVGGTLADQLRRLGAEVIVTPVTIIEPMDPRPIDRAVMNLASYDWLILTSQTGVRLFWDGLRRAGLDARALTSVRVAVIGPVTGAALRERGIIADVTPRRFVAEGLLNAFASDPKIRGARILYATAADARDTLPNGLRDLGAAVDVVTMYRSIPDRAVRETLTAAIDAGQVDLITFASTSAVEAYVALVGPERAAETRAISIGPITSAAARDHAISVVAEASESTIDSLVDAVLALRT
jgi:uroporphyrinogen-III synthase